ncbi:hypothetical protein ACOQFV_24035 [Nocardiopsis changdeensis]|uniref:Uncharacterized protein n=1 Tax=Nocardiopsis changdeensis TaxID=2831969 RepID=A0A975KS67_9ACTN|nr:MULTISPECIES: hypothetical protein [Nocardiopsis]QUX26535.1 hypothetical protein KGD84_33085 [Nocardiopsis changdeensis]QYX40654.1 hypothetical protein K1J57_32155 [Nocardiopsis sp. MT53]
MSFTLDTALVPYAFADSPTRLADPPELGHIVRVDLARERITARLALPEHLSAGDEGRLRPDPLPQPPAAGKPLLQDFRLTLPPAPAAAVEAWLTGVLAPLAATIREGVTWLEPPDLHDAEPRRPLVTGFAPAAAVALAELAQAQEAAWDQGLDTATAVPEPWRAYTWHQACRSERGGDDHGLLGGFTLGGARYVRISGGGSIRQWWTGAPAELARLLVKTTPAWALRPHRNQGVAVLVWDRPDLALAAHDIETGQAPAPVAVAEAVADARL